MLAASDHDFLHVLFLTFDSRGLAETTEGAALDQMLELVKKDPSEALPRSMREAVRLEHEFASQ